MITALFCLIILPACFGSQLNSDAQNQQDGAANGSDTLNNNSTDPLSGPFSGASDGIPFVVDLPAGLDVANLKVETPTSSDSEFVLRATLPIPGGLFPRDDGKFPLCIENGDSGEFAIAQMEVVSRYPDFQQAGVKAGADVVELLALVNNKVSQNGVADYKVNACLHSYAPTDPSATPREHLLRTAQLPQNMANLLANQTPVKLVAFDANDCRYELDILQGDGGVSFERSGPVMNTVHTHDYMMPVAGSCNASTSPMPHLFGVHAFVSTMSQEDSLIIDLNLHNGPVGLDGQEPIGRLYFSTVGMNLPSGTTLMNMVNDPLFRSYQPPNNSLEYTATSSYQPIVDQLNHGSYTDSTVGGTCFEGNNDQGDLHVLSALGSISRRLALTTTSKQSAARRLLDQYGHGFAFEGNNSEGDRFYSWSNPQTARYFPHAQLVPSLKSLPNAVNAIRGKASTMHAELLQTRETGCKSNAPSQGAEQGMLQIANNLLGHAMPLGGQYGGQTSGNGIFDTDGYEVILGYSRKAILKHQLLFEMDKSRNFREYYHADGRPFSAKSYDSPQSSGLLKRKYRDFDLGPRAGNNTESPNYAPGDWQQKVGSASSDPNYAHFEALAASMNPGSRAPGYQDEYIGSANAGGNGGDGGYDPHDTQHYGRGFHNALTLVWLSNDPLAKQAAKLYGNLAIGTFDYRSYNNDLSDSGTFSMFGNFKDVANTSTSNNALLNQSVAALINFQQGGGIDSAVTGDLNQGFGFGRARFWLTHAALAAYRVESPSWRQANDRWFGNLIELVYAGVSQCSGLLLRAKVSKESNGVPVNNFAGLQLFEGGLGLMGMYGLFKGYAQDAKPALETKIRQVIGDIAKGSFTSAWDHGGDQWPWYAITVDETSPSNPALYYYEEFAGPNQPSACSGSFIASGQDTPVHPIIEPGVTASDLHEKEDLFAAPAFGHRAQPLSSFNYLEYGAKMAGAYNPGDNLTQMAAATATDLLNEVNLNAVQGHEFIRRAPLIAICQELAGDL